jgi:XTP/dITP diphosphohydrolase
VPVTLYAATTNPGKLRDFSVAAAEGGLTVAPLPDLNEVSAPAENQPTFAGNARLKAQYYSGFAPGFVLADDSGIEVDALGGEPGVRSARFAEDAGYVPRGTGEISIDARNNLYLLSRLRGVALRTARYRCALALARDHEVLLTAEGFVDGQILTAPRGTGGFGYDPLFYLPQFRLTMAEISIEQKNVVSHRGRALRALLPGLRKLIS